MTTGIQRTPVRMAVSSRYMSSVFMVVSSRGHIGCAPTTIDGPETMRCPGDFSQLPGTTRRTDAPLRWHRGPHAEMTGRLVAEADAHLARRHDRVGAERHLLGPAPRDRESGCADDALSPGASPPPVLIAIF